MIIVLDASAAVEIALGRSSSSALHETLAEAASVLAPDIFVAEVTNAFWKYHRFSALPKTTCEDGIKNALELVDQIIPAASLVLEVFSASCLTQHPAYDLFYLILARRYSASILSLDGKIIECAHRLGVSCAVHT